MNQYMATLAKNLKELMGDMTVCELSKNVGDIYYVSVRSRWRI